MNSASERVRRALAWGTLGTGRRTATSGGPMIDNGTPEPTAPDTIVLVHGFWVTPRSWEK
jgi:hypothetical protein